MIAACSARSVATTCSATRGPSRSSTACWPRSCRPCGRGCPAPAAPPHHLPPRSWWSGPELFVLVDDYELVSTAGRNPLAVLLEFLPQARDIGLHVIVARGAGGASRALSEPMLQRIRELGSPGVVLSGDKDEGVLLGDVKPSQ